MYSYFITFYLLTFIEDNLNSSIKSSFSIFYKILG